MKQLLHWLYWQAFIQILVQTRRNKPRCKYLQEVLQWLFSGLWSYPLMRWMVPLLPEIISGRKSAVGLFRGWLRAYLFLWQLQRKGFDSLCLNILGIVILVVIREKHVFLKGSSGTGSFVHGVSIWGPKERCTPGKEVPSNVWNAPLKPKFRCAMCRIGLCSIQKLFLTAAGRWNKTLRQLHLTP